MTDGIQMETETSGISEFFTASDESKKDPFYIIREGAHYSVGHPKIADPLSQYRRAMSQKAHSEKERRRCTNQSVESILFGRSK